MTDDLERRLREAVRDRSGNEPSLSALQRAALCWKTRSSRSVSRDEAADEIARLRAENEALRAENFKLAAGACNVEGGLIGDDHGHFDCSLKARIEALERELAEAVAAERFCRECGASVAVDPSFMACHCRTMIWPIRNGERG